MSAERITAIRRECAAILNLEPGVFATDTEFAEEILAALADDEQLRAELQAARDERDALAEIAYEANEENKRGEAELQAALGEIGETGGVEGCEDDASSHAATNRPQEGSRCRGHFGGW